MRSAREHVASAVAEAGLPDTANLTESECSNTTEWWRSRVRAAETIEEISRLQVNFRKLKQLQEESSILVSSGSEEEWEQDSAARVEYFRGKVLRMFDEASRVATSSGIGSEEHGESSSPTVDMLVTPTAEYVGHWSPATISEDTPGAEMAPQTPPPPGMIATGAEVCRSNTRDTAAFWNDGFGCYGTCGSQGCLGKGSSKGFTRIFGSGTGTPRSGTGASTARRAAKGATEVFSKIPGPHTQGQICRSEAQQESECSETRQEGWDSGAGTRGSFSSGAGACSAEEEAASSQGGGFYRSDCQAGVYVAISTPASSTYLPDAESGAYDGAPNAAEDADASGDASRCAAARGDAAGCASASDDAAWCSTASDDAAGDAASRHDATTDGHDDAYVSYYARFFARTASRWTVPLLPTSFVRKGDRKVKRLKIRRGMAVHKRWDESGKLYVCGK